MIMRNGSRGNAEVLRSGRGRVSVIARGILRTGIFQLRQYLAQGHDQFVARNMALLELNPELERFVLRLEMENKGLRPLRTRLIFPAFTASFIARQSALQDALKHLQHLFFGGLS